MLEEKPEYKKRKKYTKRRQKLSDSYSLQEWQSLLLSSVVQHGH